MATRLRVTLVAFIVWTAFVWVNRISNALRSDETSGAKTFSTVLSIAMLVLALAVLVALVRGWSKGVDRTGARWLLTAAIVTVVVWLVRVPQILLTDHTAGFKVVHVLLGVVSVVLAALVWQIGVAANREADAAVGPGTGVGV